MKKIISITLTLLLFSFSVYAEDIKNATITGYHIGHTNRRILPLGDSITLGSQSTDGYGYRKWLQIFQRNKYECVGPYTDGNDPTNYSNEHAGIGGNTTAQIEARTLTALQGYMSTDESVPQAVLLHAGHNDSDMTAAIENIEDIIIIIDDYNPTIEIYVALVIPACTSSTAYDRLTGYNDDLTTRLESLQSTYSQIVIVDQETAIMVADECDNFFHNCLADNVHPNNAGYYVMARTWSNCIEDKTATYCNGN